MQVSYVWKKWPKKFTMRLKTRLDEPSKSTYHIEDGLQYKVYVDRGETRPVVDRSNPAVVFPEERPGQLVQS